MIDKRWLSAVLTLLFAAGLGLLIGAAPEPVSEPADDTPTLNGAVVSTPTTPVAGLAAPQASLTGPARQLAELRLASDFRSAMQSLQARSLNSDPLRVTAHEEIRSACALVHRPDAASPRVDLDPNRRPWLDQLQGRCAGLNAAALRPLPPDDPAAQRWRAQVPEAVAQTQGRDAARMQAEQLLRNAVDVRLLYAALRYRLVEQQLPLDEIFHGSRVPVQADIELSLVNAADLIACVRSHSCGSEGLWTLYTCAQFGCPAGIDLQTAMRRNAPQWQFEITLAVARWVLRLG